MLKINGKTFMNIQEAVQWLLDNNALPFQSSANYIANTEIGMGTIVNPSPAKVRIGSLIFFADSKVSTVTGLTENGFICSDQYNNLVDDIAYVTNVAINASGHLITTLSDGQTIDAGIIKQVSGFSIDASQHLIVTYNDGSTTDLGAIFSGNVTISGNLTASNFIASNVQRFLDNSQYHLDEDFSLSVKDVTSISPDLSVKIKYAHKRISNGKLTVVVQIALENEGASSVSIPASTALLTADNFIILPVGVASFIFGAGPAPAYAGVIDTMAGIKSTAYFISNGYFDAGTDVIELKEGNLNKSGNNLVIEYSPRTSATFTLGAGKGVTWRKEFNLIL